MRHPPALVMVNLQALATAAAHPSPRAPCRRRCSQHVCPQPAALHSPSAADVLVLVGCSPLTAHPTASSSTALPHNRCAITTSTATALGHLNHSPRGGNACVAPYAAAESSRACARNSPLLPDPGATESLSRLPGRDTAFARMLGSMHVVHASGTLRQSVPCRHQCADPGAGDFPRLQVRREASAALALLASAEEARERSTCAAALLRGAHRRRRRPRLSHPRPGLQVRLPR